MSGHRYYKLGSWLFFAVGPMHLAGHMLGKSREPANQAESDLLHLATGYQFDMGGLNRSFMNIYDGFSLSIVVLFILAGGLNILIVRHVPDNHGLMRAGVTISLAGPRPSPSRLVVSGCAAPRNKLQASSHKLDLLCPPLAAFVLILATVALAFEKLDTKLEILTAKATSRVPFVVGFEPVVADRAAHPHVRPNLAVLRFGVLVPLERRNEPRL